VLQRSRILLPTRLATGLTYRGAMPEPAMPRGRIWVARYRTPGRFCISMVTGSLRPSPVTKLNERVLVSGLAARSRNVNAANLASVMIAKGKILHLVGYQDHSLGLVPEIKLPM
jgi:hypothetical protein